MTRVPLCALLALLMLTRGATQPNCATYQDKVGATFKHTNSRTEPCEGKGERTPCRYYLNLTHPNGEFHTRNKPVDGCCVLDISGKSFCSSERSKSANPTALTVKQLLNLTYVCKDGRATVKTFCPEGYQTFCSQGLMVQGLLRQCACYQGQEKYQGCDCEFPNTGEDCTRGGDSACTAGGRCVTFSSTMDAILAQGTELRFFDAEKQPDGAEVLRAKPSSWFGDEKAGTRPMSEHSWWWQNDEGGSRWEQFDEFNSFALEQAYSDDRQLAILEFAGFARGSVVANLGDMTMGDTVTPDNKRRQIRRQASTGQQHMPETLNGRIQADALPDMETLRRASVLP